MRYFLFFCFFVFVSSASAYDADTDLLLHLNELPVIDSSLDGHDITRYNGSIVSGHFDNCLRLDGDGDYLESPDSSAWTLPSSFTIDFWYKFNSVKNYTWFVGQGGLNGTNSWCFMYTNSGLGFYVSVADNTTFSFVRDFSPSTGTWYHLAIVNNAGDWSMYVNGSRLGSVYNNSYSIPNLSSSLFIGAGTNGTNNYVDGWVDELRISGVARWTGNFDVPTEEYAPPPTPTPTPYATPCEPYAATPETDYKFLMSLGGVFCGFLFAFGLLLAFRG